MAELNDDWSAESNEALQISLVVPDVGTVKTLHTFNPKMTYSIFGDDERIFGYKGLKINLRYNASDMRPNLQILYDKKFKAVGETEATDVNEVLQPYLPKIAFEKPSVFDKAVSDPISKDWSPPGDLHKIIKNGSKTLEVWKGNLGDPAVQQTLKRIQVLVPLFIEGGTVIELDDPEWTLERWTVFFLYQKNDFEESRNPYVFMGYSTVYRYYHFLPSTSKEKDPDFKFPPDSISFSSLPCRSRISQFIILPPFQGGGNGSRFYNCIFDFYHAEPETIEITVEDPNYAFDDMRDLNDLARLRAIPEFSNVKINNKIKPSPAGVVPRDIVDLTALEKLRKSVKIAPRQFLRVAEMHLLSKIPLSIRSSILEDEPNVLPQDTPKLHEYNLWALWVKKRLYKHNKDLLSQLDKEERLEKLDEVLSGVLGDYTRLLNLFEKRSEGANDTESNGKSNGKRSNADNEAGEPSAKKIKVSL